MTSLHRIVCGKCGYPSLARRGKTLCCGVSIAYESKVKVKVYKRKRKGSAKEPISKGDCLSIFERPDPDTQLKLW
jgi:uncharacterized Zn finger protein (UPF0148 family)